MNIKNKTRQFSVSACLLAVALLPIMAKGQTVASYRTKNNTTDIVKKYSLLLSADRKDIERFKTLYSFIDPWMNVPYKWGGCDMAGIDCSCFVTTIFNEVYNIKLKRTSFAQFYDNDVSLFKNKNSYATGDLVFFKTSINRETKNNRITHVGLYLTNGYFVQSSSGGVNIANLNNRYWKNCMVAAGRLKESFYVKAGMKINKADIDENNTKFVAEEDSRFEPPLMAERYDSIIKKYALLLEVPLDAIVFPEMFAFLDSIEKQPYTKDCKKKAGRTECMIADLYKTVFKVDIDAAALALNDTALIEPWKKKDVLSEGDIVYFGSSPRLKNPDVTGIYLHNGHVAFIESDRLVMKPVVYDKTKQRGMKYARFKNSILEMASQNLMAARRIEDSLSRQISIAPVKQEPVINLPQRVDVELAFTLNQNKLHEMVQAVEVPYQETPDKEYVPIVIRYAKELNLHPLYLNNPLLLSFINTWRDKNYKKGACTDKKIGNECFITKYFAAVYDREINIKNISRLNGSYLKQLDDKAVLKAGDVLFFGKRYEASYDLNFVGIYLGGKSFIALSPFTQKVTMCSVTDKLYEDSFLAAARPL